MFRKLRDRISSGLQSATESLAGKPASGTNDTNNSSSSSSNNNNNNKSMARNSAAGTGTLVSMGFSESAARRAMRQFQGNVQRAAEYLLSTSAPPSAVGSPNNSNGNASQASVSIPASAIQRSHPSVHVPPTMQQKSKQEQIFRTVRRLEKHPNAVDTLYKTIQQVRQNPNDRKFWTIDCSRPAAHKLLSTPGAFDFLQALNYRKTNRNILRLQFYDAATMYMGTLALGQCQAESEVYQRHKQLQQFEVSVSSVLASDNDVSEQERTARLQHRQKVPSLSASQNTNGGLGSPIFVYFDGMDELPGQPHKYLTRNFDGDDTMEDVLHWLASHGSSIWNSLVVSSATASSNDRGNSNSSGIVNKNNADAPAWQLFDMNQTNAKPIYLSVNRNQQGIDTKHAFDGENALPKTLQSLGFWPSGKLVVRPAPEAHAQSRIPIRNLTATSATTTAASRAVSVVA